MPFRQFNFVQSACRKVILDEAQGEVTPSKARQRQPVFGLEIRNPDSIW